MYPDDNQKPSVDDRIKELKEGLRNQRHTIRNLCERVKTLEESMIDVKEGLMNLEEKKETDEKKESWRSPFTLEYATGSGCPICETYDSSYAREIAEFFAMNKGVDIHCWDANYKLIFVSKPVYKEGK